MIRKWAIGEFEDKCYWEKETEMPVVKLWAVNRALKFQSLKE